MNVTAVYPPKGAGLESLITETVSCWDRLKAEKRPIFIYGMGDGAMKIMSVFRQYDIAVAGIFASDEFVRGHSFAGYRVHKLSEVEEMVEDFVIVLAFAAGYPSLVEYIRNLAARHPLYVPDVPVIGSGLFTYEYCMSHLQELNEVYRSLADDESRRVFLNIIQFKISGDLRYLDAVTAETDDIYKHILRPTRTETFVDLGAYNGDTIRELMEYTNGKYFAIHAVEPDKKNFKKLRAFVEESELKHISLHHCAAWCKDTELPFNAKSGRQSVLAPEGQMLPARCVDSIMAKKSVTFLKMDVEGFEREALWGASGTIMRHQPKLAVAIYHRNEDLFELPLLVKQLNPGYKLYIRHRLYIPAWETNLYAVAD
ncbi:MAG: FkbM family methyltransferase [Oscillospiraceae bacterium]|nr:FkbM family methyltransferase [Oscillospiraceae bacterium]